MDLNPAKPSHVAENKFTFLCNFERPEDGSLKVESSCHCVVLSSFCCYCVVLLFVLFCYYCVVLCIDCVYCNTTTGC